MGGIVTVFGGKNRLDFRFRPEKAFGFRRRPFFLRSPVFGGKNRLDFRFRPEKSLRISAKTLFFFEITCFWPEKPLKFSISARKSLRISAKTFFFRDHLIFTEISPQSNLEFRNNENLGEVRLLNKLLKNPGYVPVLH